MYFTYLSSENLPDFDCQSHLLNLVCPSHYVGLFYAMLLGFMTFDSAQHAWRTVRDAVKLLKPSVCVCVCVCWCDRRSCRDDIWQRACSSWQHSARWRSWVWDCSGSARPRPCAPLHENDWLGGESTRLDDQPRTLYLLFHFNFYQKKISFVSRIIKRWELTPHKSTRLCSGFSTRQEIGCKARLWTDQFYRCRVWHKTLTLSVNQNVG